VTGALSAAWTLSLGLDFLFNGGLLAPLYLAGGPFLLSPEESLRRFPLGCTAGLILTVGFWWFLIRLDVRGWAEGFRYGLSIPAFVWGAFLIGLFSISTVPIPLLLGWWAGQSFQLALVGGVLGAAAAGVRISQLWMLVALAIIVLCTLTVILQYSVN